MWMDEEDAHLEEHNSSKLVNRFNLMLKESSSFYFDVDQLEVIIDHYLERSKPKAALRAVEHGLSIFDHNNFLLLRKGQILISLGAFEHGKSILVELLDSDPENQEILFGLGMAYAQEHDAKKAIYYYKLAYDAADIELKVEVLVELALQYQITDSPEKALACYRKALGFNERAGLVLRELNNFIKRNDLLVEGEQVIQDFLDNHPYSHKAWFHLGQLYFQFELFEKAVSAYDFALTIKEDYALVYYKKAESLIKLKAYEPALEAMHEELKYREPMALNFCIMADCYENLDDFSQAEVYYKKAIKKDEYFSEAYIGLGFLKEIQFDYLSALPYYEKAVELEPDNYNAHLMLSSVLTELARTDEAKAVVSNLLTIEQGIEEAWIELAYIYASEDDLDHALSIVDEGIETAFSNEQLWLKKVVYLHKIGKRMEAIELARELLVEDKSVKVTLANASKDLLKDPEFVMLLNQF